MKKLAEPEFGGGWRPRPPSRSRPPPEVITEVSSRSQPVEIPEAVERQINNETEWQQFCNPSGRWRPTSYVRSVVPERYPVIARKVFSISSQFDTAFNILIVSYPTPVPPPNEYAEFML